ncbi:hypothetical protein [Oceanobacillus alkalisoli]|uniref:hypothetical protein n=1 Tax=Oceanobacillus alkalisoli TaxID=2925113 RepID=UPI001EF00C5F|nr:hypothetical protein [Oceanobacillus alkalisoli]MCF3944777.1 hypothetical protein [Oceanobacillus alkalisoli]MCG5105263.1 hypothetical protein [Oceanobacillus alkalisoli]
MKINWASFFTFFIVMAVVDLVVFDNMALRLAFIIIGVCSGLIFATEKKQECN